jgi:hypothetical protein
VSFFNQTLIAKIFEGAESGQDCSSMIKWAASFSLYYWVDNKCFQTMVDEIKDEFVRIQAD